MLQDKRIHKRFDVSTVVEIKSLKSPTNFCLGITRNFSYEGFSFESQSRDLDIGENIGFKINHPQDSSYFSDAAEIVWKQRDNKYDYCMGVKFKEIDKATKSKMLEILSLAGNIPVDSFLSDKNDKDIHLEDTGAIDNEIFVNEPEKTGLFEDVEAAHDEAFELDKEEVSDTGLTMDIGQAIYDNISPIRKDQRKKIWLYLPIAITIIVALFVIFENFNKIFKNPFSASTKAAPHEDIDKKHSTPIVVDAQTGNIEYYIQVGAWQYSDYAQKMLIKLKRYYPDAYITVENNLHKVRIPKIMNKRQGDDISKDIEGKFNIKAIIVRKIK
jgi:hypothetical protein